MLERVLYEEIPRLCVLQSVHVSVVAILKVYSELCTGKSMFFYFVISLTSDGTALSVPVRLHADGRIVQTVQTGQSRWVQTGPETCSNATSRLAEVITFKGRSAVTRLPRLSNLNTSPQM